MYEPREERVESGSARTFNLERDIAGDAAPERVGRLQHLRRLDACRIFLREPLCFSRVGHESTTANRTSFAGSVLNAT